MNLLSKYKTARHITLTVIVGIFLLLLPLHTGASEVAMPSQHAAEIKTKKVAIVIDDFGNNMDGTKEMLDLPIQFTVAVMPFLPSSKQDAQLAHDKGHEVILHLPMEPVRGKKSWLGPGAITTDLSSDEIHKRIVAAIDDIPYVIGINNHMGSKATADERVMKILIDICKEKNLILLDSRTTPKSLIGKLAGQNGVPYSENQLFFDDLYTYSHISNQMVKFKKLIHQRDVVIAIGHVGPPGKKTAQVIKEAIPIIQKEATFVPISQTMKLNPN
ncbi:divergent polysaccharide deacetylase family protein [Paenibacillus alginolyticus]|uniref:divergent polysaccharide deacetylase family protein n=1 Tax=Paenibacillus alginolyticus TaxID=59839 RepID=UPI000416FCAA|nr:divergent polysaccharide deacetylase family protein [Paenibacillus alginolyticus]MCY9663798.1 divergent polysaccharide deacetylase family protein [Paenibacillus alginolyticus]